MKLYQSDLSPYAIRCRIQTYAKGIGVMLEIYLTNTGHDRGDYAVGGRPSLADCALVPALFVAVELLPGSGMAEPLAAMPALARYWHAIQKDEYCGRVLAERTATLEARMGNA